MELSEVYPQNGLQCSSIWSPDCRLVATSFKTRLLLRIASSLQLVRFFTCDFVPQAISWAPNGKMIAVAHVESGSIQIFSIEASNWCYRLKHGLQGLASIFWSPTSTHLLTIDKYQVKNHDIFWN